MLIRVDVNCLKIMLKSVVIAILTGEWISVNL